MRKHSPCVILSVVRVVFGVEIDLDVHDVVLGRQRADRQWRFCFTFRLLPLPYPASSSPPITACPMFSEKYLLRFSLIGHSEREVCV